MTVALAATTCKRSLLPPFPRLSAYLQGDKPPGVVGSEGASGETGQAVVQLLEAMYKSAKSGKAEKVVA